MKFCFTIIFSDILHKFCMKPVWVRYVVLFFKHFILLSEDCK